MTNPLISGPHDDPSTATFTVISIPPFVLAALGR